MWIIIRLPLLQAVLPVRNLPISSTKLPSRRSYGRTEVIQEDLEESVEVVIAGAQRKGAVISEKEKQLIAYHEIGHALVAASQTASAPVHKITIIPGRAVPWGILCRLTQRKRSL